MEINKQYASQEESREVIVSVLMTVYNEERFLAQSLDSILAQDEKRIEIVVVDDASTDGSPRILKSYSDKDKRIVVLRNCENVGLIKSRICALQNSRGQYVMLVDADDFISKDAIGSALQAMRENNVETAVLDLQMYYDDNKILPYSNECFGKTMSGKEAFVRCVEGRLHGLCVEHRKHYKQIPFDDSCKLYSDDNTARIHYYICPEICFCKGKYFYRQHSESETHNISFKRFDYILANISLRMQMLALHAPKDVLQVVEIHRWKNIVAHYKLLQEYRGKFTTEEQHKALFVLDKAIKSIDFQALPMKLKLRPPYWPARNLMTFMVWQKIYQMSRKLYRTLFKLCLTSFELCQTSFLRFQSKKKQ